MEEDFLAIDWEKHDSVENRMYHAKIEGEDLKVSKNQQHRTRSGSQDRKKPVNDKVKTDQDLIRQLKENDYVRLEQIENLLTEVRKARCFIYHSVKNCDSCRKRVLEKSK